MESFLDSKHMMWYSIKGSIFKKVTEEEKNGRFQGVNYKGYYNN